MRKAAKITLIICGWLMLAAVPVLAQEVRINKRPFIDLGEFVVDKIDREKVDLAQPFKVVLDGRLIRKTIKTDTGEESGTVGFDQSNSNWIVLSDEEAGDAQVGEIAKEAIQAVGDSGFLAYLYDLGTKNIKITSAQDNDKVFLIIESEQPTETKAKTIASGLNALLAIAGKSVKAENEQILVDGVKSITSNDRILVINFELPKDVARKMIDQSLREYRNRGM